MSITLTLLLTIAVYALTLPLAWRLLARLVAHSAGHRAMWANPTFWAEVALYRLVIFAPYGVLLLMGRWLPSDATKIIVGWVILTSGLSLVRLAGTDRVVGLLWYLYGHCYDSLRGFFPYRRLVDLAVARVMASGTMTVLDIGCGTGNTIERLLEEHPCLRVVGVDGSASMLGRARRKLQPQISKGHVQLVQADVMGFVREQPAASYDRIILMNVLYAVRDRGELWRECLRLLKPSGAIVVTTSDRGGSRSIVAEHLRHDHWWRLVKPRLLATGIIDCFITEFARAGIFQFPSEAVLLNEVRGASGRPGIVTRCYGDVNVLFSVHHVPPP